MSHVMLLDDWMDDLQDAIFFGYGKDEYMKVCSSPFKWEVLYEEGLTVDEAIKREYGDTP